MARSRGQLYVAARVRRENHTGSIGPGATVAELWHDKIICARTATNGPIWATCRHSALSGVRAKIALSENLPPTGAVRTWVRILDRRRIGGFVFRSSGTRVQCRQMQLRRSGSGSVPFPGRSPFACRFLATTSRCSAAACAFLCSGCGAAEGARLFADEAEACAHTKCHAWALSALPTVAASGSQVHGRLKPISIFHYGRFGAERWNFLRRVAFGRTLTGLSE